MKQEQLNAIKERVAKATPGPWKVAYDTDDRDHVVDVWFNSEDNGHAEIHDNSFGNAPYNAKFISLAREDVPALVEYIESLHELRKDDFLVMCESKDEVRKMRLKVERLRKALEEIMEDQAPIMEGWETTTYEIARKALGGEAHE
ncbi:hypothetical protein ACP3VS_21990 [Lysinibacillus sp. VIII_CA]|uniref:hypothetical protein n=1 Tax=Lysinibacillus sp. VIII_CA TaxID=3417452 RepID=UPI003CEA9F79